MRLIVDELKKSFGERTLFDRLTFSADLSKPLFLTGPSGIGKTTFLRMLMGLERPDGGTITFEGVPAEPVRFGVVFQDNRLSEDYSALENVMSVCSRDAEPRILEDFERLLPQVDPKQPVYRLSGGEKRRVCLIRACRADAGVLVLDEPFTGLDEQAKEKCFAYLLQIAGQRPIICALHETDIPQGNEPFRLGSL